MDSLRHLPEENRSRTTLYSDLSALQAEIVQTSMKIAPIKVSACNTSEAVLFLDLRLSVRDDH